MAIYTYLNNQSILVLITGSVLVCLAIIFFGSFLMPGLLLRRRLGRIKSLLAKIDSKDKVNYVKNIGKVFESDKRLAHLWKEYRESLHTQKEQRGGQLVDAAVRATIPAEMVFNAQAVVDGRLYTEFFKNIPGIFTGIGIIGTFSGLIQGLQQFNVSEDAVKVRNSLESLMHSVGGAFSISALAIVAAMVATFLEKLLIAHLYRLTEDIANAIDAKFVSGAGEEYMARLVQASEDSASQAKILKDALVEDLGVVLRNLNQEQIAANRLLQAELGATITKGIGQSLKEPLDKIADTVGKASGDQSATAARLLQDVMASFTERLNTLFGGQIEGITKLNQQTNDSVKEAVNALRALVANMEAASERSVGSIAKQMAEAMEKMQLQQEAMNAQASRFIEQISKLVSDSQSETHKTMVSSLDRLGAQVENLINNLANVQKEAFRVGQEHEKEMADRSQKTVNDMSASVDKAINELCEATNRMSASIAELTKMTSSSIEGMQAGALKLDTAARNFASAGERVSGVLGQAAGISEKLAAVSGGLTASGSAMQEALRDYRSQRDAVSQLVTALAATVENARREASLTTDALSRIESSAAKLGEAQIKADEYLDGVSEILSTVNRSFAEEVTKTLDKVNTEFHNKLRTAITLLSSAVDDLGVTLALRESVPQGRR